MKSTVPLPLFATLLSLLLIATVLLPDSLAGQSRPPVPPRREVKQRIENPLGFSIDFDTGAGIEYLLFESFAVDLSTVFTAYTAKARYYVWSENISPFIGVGYTQMTGDPINPNDESWGMAMLGFEYARGQGFMRLQLNYTFGATPGADRMTFTPDFSMGLRF